MKGHVVTEETRRKISETRKARKVLSPPMSDDGRKRISAAHKGKKRDPIVGKRISARAKERRELGLKRGDGNMRRQLSKFEIRERQERHEQREALELSEQKESTVVT